MLPPMGPPEYLCPHAAPHVERALQDSGWEDIQLDCRDTQLHIAARVPGEPAETPPARFVLGTPALAAFFLPLEDAARAP